MNAVSAHESESLRPPPRNAGLALALFLALVIGGGLAIGFFTRPGEWYAALAKPAFNPPNWIFAPVWSLLYVFIAVAGWRVWRAGPSSMAMKVWWVQLALNFLWSPAFFAAHQVAAALVIVLSMLTAIVTFIVMAWKVDRVAAMLFIPYAAWVSFASTLNGAILVLN
jgi:translocator protein